MRIQNFENLGREQIAEKLKAASAEEREEILVDVVLRLRGRSHAPKCPACQKGHHQNRPRTIDQAGRVWHMNCAQRVLDEAARAHAVAAEENDLWPETE